jgi:hypothetical protein
MIINKNRISSVVIAAAMTLLPLLQTSTVRGSSGRPLEVTFTKWVPSFPTLEGYTGGDVAGTLAGEVLSRNPFDNGVITQLEARYEVTDPGGTHSFTAHIEGKQNNETLTAVLNGVITEGWLTGSQVHVTYDVIRPCLSEGRPVCFRGVIQIMPDSD